MNIKLINTRKKANLTQVEVANKVGISERYYQKIEAGTSKSNVETAILIAKALNSTVEKLF